MHNENTKNKERVVKIFDEVNLLRIDVQESWAVDLFVISILGFILQSDADKIAVVAA
jgi:hypothetical protein